MTEAEQAMKEVHERTCGGHYSGRMIAYKLIRLGYYYPIMQQDCSEKVKKFDKCKKFAIHLTNNPQL